MIAEAVTSGGKLVGVILENDGLTIEIQLPIARARMSEIRLKYREVMQMIRYDVRNVRTVAAGGSSIRHVAIRCVVEAQRGAVRIGAT